MEKQFIYILIDPVSNDIKYVGKSNNPEKRLKRHMSRYSLIESWTKKNKWLLYLKNENTKPIIKVIDEGNNENINELEIKWIKYYRDNGIELLNETDGGDGCLYFKGKKLSKEHIDKIKYNHPFRKSIVQFDLENNILNKYDSIHDAASELNIDRRTITRSCKGELKVIKKYYYFRYIDNYFPCEKSKSSPDIEQINIILNELISSEKKYLTKREELNLKIKEGIKESNKNKPKIIQYDLEGNVISKFDSLTEASEKTGVHVYLISNCCKKKSHYTVNGGHFWRKKNIDVIPCTFRYENDLFDYVPYNKNIQKKSKKICKYDINTGELIEIYDSIKSSSINNNAADRNISSCCKRKINKKTGKFIIVKGFTYRYFDETLGNKLI